MKYVKLIVVFALVATGLFAALMMGSLAGPKTTESGFIKEDRINVDELCNRIDGNWKNASTWDSTVYISCRREIERNRTLKKISEDSYNRARNTLREDAINKLRDSYNDLLQTSESDFKVANAKVRQCHSGVAFLAIKEQIDDVEKDARLKYVEESFNLYTRICEYVKRDHRIIPTIDAKKLSWRPFSKKQEDEIAKATALKSEAYYTGMKGFPTFASGLDENNVRRATEKSRAQFYIKLSEKIKDQFTYIVTNPDATKENHIDIDSKWVDSDKLTKEKLKKIGELYLRLYEEETNKGINKGNDDGSRALGTFKDNFNTDLKALEKKLEEMKKVKNITPAE